MNLGDVVAGSTVRFKFTTHGADGAPLAPSSAFEAADLLIYKDGSATQRSSANGITMTSPFDSIVGLHHVDIDLSDNTDAGFYAAGSVYEVVLSPDETIAGLASVTVVARFAIQRQLETGYTLDDLIRVIAAATAGKLSGAATTTVTIRDVADARNAIVATVDADGNRSAVTLDPS